MSEERFNLERVMVGTPDEARTVEQFIMAELDAEFWRRMRAEGWINCPRCGPMECFDDGRCHICGMTADTQGPSPHRQLRGIT